MLSNNKIIYQSIHLAVPHGSLCIFLSLEVYLPWVRMKLKKTHGTVLTHLEGVCTYLCQNNVFSSL